MESDLSSKYLPLSECTSDGNISYGIVQPGRHYEQGIPIIRVNNVKNGKLDILSPIKVHPDIEEKHRRTRLEGGEVLLTLVGSTGQSVIADSDLAGWNVARAIAVIRPTSEIGATWIHICLQSKDVQHFLDTRANTTVQKTLNLKDIRNIPILNLPKEKRKFIERCWTSLSDKIELNRRMNATLEGMAQALFQSWFVDFDPVLDNALAAGNPIPEELANRGEVRRQALANGTANREAAKPFPAAFQLTEELGWIPEGWEVSHLVENVRLTMGQSPSSDHYNSKGDGLPFHQGVTNYGERFPKHGQYSTGGNRFAEDGDVLFSVRAPVGRINIANCKMIIGRGLAALRHEKDHQGFLVYFLKHTFATEDSIGSGTIFNAVNKKEMERIPLIFPPDETTRVFDDIANSLDEKIASNAEQTETITKLRDSLLPKLLSEEIQIPTESQTS